MGLFGALLGAGVGAGAGYAAAKPRTNDVHKGLAERTSIAVTGGAALVGPRLLVSNPPYQSMWLYTLPNGAYRALLVIWLEGKNLYHLDVFAIAPLTVEVHGAGAFTVTGGQMKNVTKIAA